MVRNICFKLFCAICDCVLRNEAYGVVNTIILILQSHISADLFMRSVIVVAYQSILRGMIDVGNSCCMLNYQLGCRWICYGICPIVLIF